MNEPRNQLDSWLDAARVDLAQQSPPAWIESALATRQSEQVLLRRLRPEQPATILRRKPARWFLWGLPAGLAAVVVAAAGVVLLMGAPPEAQSAPTFVALTPLETIAAEPRPMVIASDVPRAQLAALGLPVDPARADLPVRAEFLVSQRGTVLAVRFSPE